MTNDDLTGDLARARDQRSRTDTEATAQRLRFLAEASAVLSSSLDHETTLRNVARLAVPDIADWCAVDLVVGDRIQRVAVEHTDPAKLELVSRLEEEFPSDHSRPHGVGQVIRTGETEFIPEIPDELLVAAAQNEDHLKLIRSLGLRSYVVVPLIARERVLGAFTLVHAESGRRFNEDDLAFAEEVSRRAAVAIDNARLVRDLEDTQRRLEEQSSELEQQAAEMEVQTEQLESQTAQQQELLRALALERTRLEAIVRHAPVGIIFAEAPGGRIVLGNPAAERILRHPVRFSERVEEYVEWEAYHEDGRRVESHEYPLARAFRTGEPEGPDELLYQRGDGTRGWIRLSATPIHDRDGGLTAGLVIIDDIDAERRAVHEREALLRQVSDERRLLQEIFDNAPAVMALYSGPDHVITMVNPQWERMVGKTDAPGRRFRDVFPEFATTGLFEILDRIYVSGEPYLEPEMQLPLERWGSGVVDETYWNLVLLPLPARDDGTRDILVHAIEISTQVRARRQVQELTEAGLEVHAAPTLAEALQVVSERARSLIGAHQAITCMGTGGDDAELLAVSLSDKYAAFRDTDVSARAMAARALIGAEASVRLSEAELREHAAWAEVGGAEMLPRARGLLAARLTGRDGSNLGVIQLSDRGVGEFTVQDEAVLMQLAQTVAVAVENGRLYESTLEASRTKSDFLATMSHELRTPLNAMIGYSELLEMGVPEPIPDASRQQVERIRLAAQHLLQLIEEILTFTRVDAGRESVLTDRVSLAVLTDEVRAIIEPLAERKDLTFDVVIPDEDVEIETDPRKLRQILLNLLGNAIKFTEEGTVAFEARTDGSDIVLHVCDTGIGMTEEEMARIYEPFWQAETAIHARSSGTGLGLPVSLKLVELLGGSLTVRSEPGRGSRFTVRLPLRIEPD